MIPQPFGWRHELILDDDDDDDEDDDFISQKPSASGLHCSSLKMEP